MVLGPLRIFLYGWLFTTSVVLLGLTGYRIHYTRGLTDGDVLTSKSHFYDAVIAELLVTSCLGILASLYFIIAIASRIGHRSAGHHIGEIVSLFVIWVMFLVGAAVTTHKWRSLKWCRGAYKACRILETIKAFSWICFAFTTFLFIAALVNMMMKKRATTVNTTPAVRAGNTTARRDEVYPDTRQTTTTTTVAPATGPTAVV